MSSRPDDFDTESSILFLGSGFSAEAENISGGNPPVGKGLTQHFLSLLGLDPDANYDLKDIATFAKEKGIDLYEVLTKLYNIRSLNYAQSHILEKRWRRIYTTNYDDAVEVFFSRTERRKTFRTFSFDMPLATKLSREAVIHLHGYINRCKRETVLRELVLSHTSYAEQMARLSPWWDQFERDIRSAEAIYFVGYSLNDFAVSAYLTRLPALSQKTHFILKKGVDEITKTRLYGYGVLHEISVLGFAGWCESAVAKPEIVNPSSMKAFKFFDPTKDNKTVTKPNPAEIDALIALGNFKFQRFIGTFPAPTYVIPRAKLLDIAVSFLEKNRTLILHSRIGNGKTIFRYCLCMRLTELGYSVFEVREQVTFSESELEHLRRQKKLAIVFNSYDGAYASIDQISGLSETTKFLVEMNTGTVQVRRAEIYGKLPSPIERIDVNPLTSYDREDLAQLLDTAGLLNEKVAAALKKSFDIRDVVLSSYDNEEVAKRIRDTIVPLLADSDVRSILVCALIVKGLGLSLDPNFIRVVTNVDLYAALIKFEEKALDIVTFDLDSFEANSALLSRYLILKIIDPQELVRWIYWLCAEAARRMHEEADLQSSRHRHARHALGILLTYSQLQELLGERRDRDELILELFEKARSNLHINAEPLFWLQYSILMQSGDRWDLAESHMATAYLRAADRDGFQTYQLDTHSLGLSLELETQEAAGKVVQRFESIFEKIDKVREMLGDGNHREHALRVLGRIDTFVSRRGFDLSTSEATRLTYLLNLVVSRLESYDVQSKLETGSDKIKDSLSRALRLLVARDRQ